MPNAGHRAKAAVLAFVALTGCNPATGAVDALFKDVEASSKWGPDGQIQRQFINSEAIPRHVVVRDRLYLLTQVTQPHLLTVNVIEQPRWQASDWEALLHQYPELRRYDSRRGWVRGP